MGINKTYGTLLTTGFVVADTVGNDGIPTPTMVNGRPVAAAIEIQSTLGALLLPRVTDAQMNAITPVVDGMMVYNVTQNAVFARENGAWSTVGAPGAGSVTSIAAGANIVMTPSPITTVGTVSLNPVLTGLTSAVIGNISIGVTTTNTISIASTLNITSATAISLTTPLINLDTTTGVIIRNGVDLLFANVGNTHSVSIGVGAITTNTGYTLPLAWPTISGQILSSTTAGIMSWVTAGGGTVTSITAGSNMTGGTITGSGTIGLSATVSGLTSLAVGNWSLSGTTIASSGVGTITTVGALTLTPTTNTLINSPLQIRSNNALVLFNSGNTFSTSLIAGAQTGNINYTMPTIAPTNGQVLSSLASGVMSWITAGSGSVTSITSGNNIVLSPGTITTTGSVSLEDNITGLTSVGIGTLSMTANSISATVGSLTVGAAASLLLHAVSVISCDTEVDILGNSGIKLFNSTNTFSTKLISGNVAADTIYTLPPAYPTINGQILSCTTTGTMAWITGNGGAPNSSKYILQQADGSLPNAQSLALLTTGLVKNTTGTGVLTIGVAGTDYYSPGNPTTIIDTGGLANKNLFVGTAAGSVSASAGDNIVFGITCLGSLTSGAGNVAIGRFVGAATTTGSSNVYVGSQSANNLNASFNAFVGYNTGAALTGTSNSNTFLGYGAGAACTSALTTTLVGVNAAASNGLSNAMALGANVSVSLSNSINIGNACNVGINIANPSYALHVNNTGGTANANFFLANTGTVPSTPTGGGILYVSGGTLFYIGTSGTVTAIAPA